MQKSWFQFLKCGDFMLFFVKRDSKLMIFGFWAVGQTKEIQRRAFFNYLLTF